MTPDEIANPVIFYTIGWMYIGMLPAVIIRKPIHKWVQSRRSWKVEPKHLVKEIAIRSFIASLLATDLPTVLIFVAIGMPVAALPYSLARAFEWACLDRQCRSFKQHFRCSAVWYGAKMLAVVFITFFVYGSRFRG
ncbi:MAG: hypothetical protein JSS72_09320 [Armatimonadetes bacterium]|nr:hypothetical protein [Armatimonadota bacterium]